MAGTQESCLGGRMSCDGVFFLFFLLLFTALGIAHRDSAKRRGFRSRNDRGDGVKEHHVLITCMGVSFVSPYQSSAAISIRNLFGILTFEN